MRARRAVEPTPMAEAIARRELRVTRDAVVPRLRHRARVGQDAVEVRREEQEEQHVEDRLVRTRRRLMRTGRRRVRTGRRLVRTRRRLMRMRRRLVRVARRVIEASDRGLQERERTHQRHPAEPRGVRGPQHIRRVVDPDYAKNHPEHWRYEDAVPIARRALGMLIVTLCRRVLPDRGVHLPWGPTRWQRGCHAQRTP